MWREVRPQDRVTDGFGEEAFDPAPGLENVPYSPFPEVPVLNRHPAQVLTVFWPHTPTPEERFPAIVWASAGYFVRANPPDDPDANDFLCEALLRGWAVISVGSTGIDSCPVAATQPQRCFSNTEGCKQMFPTPGCEDYNLWYPPETTSTSPWNDFNYFYGEKDFFWAMQYITLNADALMVDPTRLVLSGLSTGAIYSCFAAYEAEAWTDPMLSEQSRTQTSVAGLILFESAAQWVSGYPTGLAGFHWIQSSDPLSTLYYRRAPTIPDVGSDGVLGGTTLSAAGKAILRSGSLSAWVRGNSHKRIPTYFVSGDGGPGDGASNFGVSAEESPGAYSREGNSSSPLVARDPSLLLNNDLRLHDYWNALFHREDLELIDSRFHGRHSRLTYRDFPVLPVNWSFVDSRFSSTGLAPTSAAEIPLVAATFVGFGDPDMNPAAYPPALDWAEREACVEFDSSVGCRNAGDNYAVFDATPALIGQPIVLSVDLDEIDANYTHVYYLIYDAPLVIPLANDNVALIAGNELYSAFASPPSSHTTPVVPITMGITLYCQAVLFDLIGPLDVLAAFTNSQDLLVTAP